MVFGLPAINESNWGQKILDSLTFLKGEQDGRLSDATLSATFVPKWKPSTAYAVGDKVVNPDGLMVERTLAGTSGATYSGTNWKTATGPAAAFIEKTPTGANFGDPAEGAKLYGKGGNTGIGYYVFKDGASTTVASTAVGHAAGASLTTGNNHTFVGYAAGYSVTTANETTHVGSYAGWYASGDNNTSLGARALCGPNGNVPTMTGQKNTAVGVEALSTISTGSSNTAVGNEAAGGQGPNVTMTNMTVSGTTVTVTVADTGALAVGMPIAFFNVAGFTANIPNGYGYVITAILSGTQFTYTQNPAPTGTYTPSSGYLLGGSITGSNNVAVGDYALFTNQRGSQNIAIGSVALRNLDNASNNVAVGYAAMNLTTTAIDNVAMGTNAAFGLTTGGQNVYIGREAGYTATPANKSTTASGQTFIGYQAGQNDTTQGVRATGVGYSAKTQGHYATALGADTLANGTYSLAIGRGASATGNGAVAIGVDSGGAAATATAWDSFVLGTALHQVKIPGRLTTAAATASQAGLVVPHGTAPTTPNDGAIWTTTAGMFVRINGVTKTVTLT